ncbi:MAG: DUF2520 domain-containing protein [Bacteroidota bacterium]|nr:DUF2520 domain-containing protein [Bacteroidota bacterium]
MKIVLIGSGNVATALGSMILGAGHEITQVVSRNIDHAIALGSRLGAKGVALTEPEFAPADLYIVAISDAALTSIDKVSALKDKFVVHTAGSVSMDVLSNLTSQFGVLYPLQTLSKSTDKIPSTPFLVEGNSKETLDRITRFAQSISDHVREGSENDRLNYHIAAVFASNFTNHLFAVTEAFCEKERIDFRFLIPLINEVTQRINTNSPFEVQTGPAVREDIFTVNRHLQKLSSHADLKYLYLKLSESILKLHEKHLG